MFELNSKSEVNKEFRVRDILKIIDADKEIKKEAKVIEKILLKNVITKDTFNIKSDDYCKEIYIFYIELSSRDIPINFIKNFDKAIELHTYFIFRYQEEIKELCIYRYIENKNIIRKAIFFSDWMKEKKEEKELPFCITVKEVYDNLIYNLLELKPRDKEELNDYIERYKSIKKLKKEIEVLQNKAFKEIQPKKKFAIKDEMSNKKKILRNLER